MSDNVWRIKRYYTPRVLIATADVLIPPFEDLLVCLTGAELNIVRNLLAYAHRRSTFVSEYADTYYLAPTTEEWDDLEAIVADLEDKLMNCTDLELLLTQIRDCVCDIAKRDWPNGGIHEGQRDYDDYQSPVQYGVGDPPEEFEDWDEWTQYKCKAAQRIIDDLTDLGERLEIVYTSGAAITFAVFQTLVLGTAVAPPVALVVMILSILAIAGTALAMLAFENWLQENKADLVCAIFTADTVGEARAAIVAYIDEHWDLALASAFGEHLFSYDVLSKAFDGGLDVSGYSSNYCEICEEELVVGDGWWALPVFGGQWEFDLYKAPGGGTVTHCLPFALPNSDWHFGGLAAVVSEQAGQATRAALGDGCEGYVSSGNMFFVNTENLTNGAWIIVKFDELPENDIVAALHPGGSKLDKGRSVIGPYEMMGAFAIPSGSAEGSSHVCVTHLVFIGEPPW